MSKRILAASPQISFGDLLRLSLEKGSDYSVFLSRNGSDVLAAISRENFDLAILDGELKDQPFLSLIQNMHVQQPQIRIVVIPQIFGNTRESLKPVTVDGFLDKPINLNDLIGLVKNLTADDADLMQKMVLPQVPRVVIKNPIETKWIEDHDTFQQNLFQLASRSIAQAVFVMQDQLVWAQASREDAVYNHQVIDLFLRAWDGKSRLDLVKIFRQTREKPTWLMYATSLIDNYSLIMIFDARIPMHEIRGHVIRMANGLSDIHLFESNKDEETGFFKSLKDLEMAQSLDDEKNKPGAVPFSGESLSKPLSMQTGKFVENQDYSLVFAPKDRNNRLVGAFKEDTKKALTKFSDDKNWKLSKLLIRPDHLVCVFDQSVKIEAGQIAIEIWTFLETLVPKAEDGSAQTGVFWDEKPLIINENDAESRRKIQDYVQGVQSGNRVGKE